MKKYVALIFAASALLLPGCCTTSHAIRWEYKVASPHLPHGGGPDANRVEGPEAVREAQQALLNDLAKEGWILVSQTDGRYFYFKRPVR
jgi:hypothetical protein